MFILITERVVKVSTGAKEKFAPRSANQTRLTASGPFATHKIAQRAALAALASHTCLSAGIMSAEKVREQAAKGYANRHETQQVLDAAVKLLDATG